jgi:hypothetical protein
MTTRRLSQSLNVSLLSAIVAGLLISSVAIQPADAFWPFSKKKKKEEVEQVDPSAEATDGEMTEPMSEEAAPSTEPTAEVIPQPYREPEPKVEVRSPISPTAEMTVEDPVNSADAPPQKIYVTVDDPKNPLGITTSAETLQRVTTMIEQKKYAQARVELEPLLNWLVDSTEAHITLNKTLAKVPSARVQAELEKQLALQFALLRDKAFFNRALIAMGEKKNGEAVKSLSKVIASQPRSPMGLKAYELLQSMGFTEKIQVQEASN